jgi:hypothetical protein
VSPAPTAGQQFGAYRLDDILGRGGMGVVYRAEHVHLGRVVALKVLAPELSSNEDFRGRFLRESRLAAALDHPNVVTVYDAGDVDGSLFLAMQMIGGEDLAGVLRSRGALEPQEALRMLAQVANALDAAHAAGLVHRDVKPGNVLVDDARCYLTDFGLTKRTQADMTAMTATGVFLGTPDYAAPEQISASRVDGRADVYALGAMLHECLTGSRPFPRDAQIAVIYAQLHEPPPRPSEVRPGLPSAIDHVVERAMAKAPSQRYATCGELIAAARQALEGQATAPRQVPRPAPVAPVETAPAPEPVPTPPPSVAPPRTAATAAIPPAPPAHHTYRAGRQRSRAPLLGLAAAVLIAVVVAAVLLGGGDDGGSSSDESESSPARVAGDPIRVGQRPFGVALAGGRLWVANNSSNTVTRMSPDGSERTQVRVEEKPFGLTTTGDAVWVVQTETDSVLRIDATTGQSSKADVGDEPYFAAADGDSVYVSSGGDGTVTVLDAASGRPRGEPIEVGGSLRGIAAADGVVWVADKQNNVVHRIKDGRVDLRAPVGKNPVQVAIGGGAVWVANKESDSVTRVEPDGGATRTLKVGDEPFGIAYGAGFVWVTNGGDDTVTRIDAETFQRSGRVRIPGQPTGITVADGSIWVTANDAGTVTRIDPGS